MNARKKPALVLLLFAMLLAACAAPAVPTWQEQYDLGVRYLSEEKFEEAIVAFTAAIEIDPKRAEAYVGVAKAYVAQGDEVKAVEWLQKGAEQASDTSELTTMLSELGAGASETIDSPVDDTAEPETEIQNEEGHTTNQLSVRRNLELSGFSYSFGPGEDTINEGSLGWMYLDAEIIGPSDVAQVLIAEWKEDSWSDGDINENMIFFPDIWKKEGAGRVEKTSHFSSSFPVYQKYLGKTVNVLLIAVDENIDAIGYTIVPVSIPNN